MVDTASRWQKSGEDIESGKKTITAKAQMPEEFTQLKNRLLAETRMSCSNTPSQSRRSPSREPSSTISIA